MDSLSDPNKPVEICRVCLEVGENLASLAHNSDLLLNLNLIHYTIVENLKLTENPRICPECSEQVKKLASFKENITTNESKIRCYQRNDNNLFLQSLCGDFNKICRLCLNTNSKQYDILWKDCIKILGECDIELNLDIDHPSKICTSCSEILNELHVFNTASNDKEELISTYFDSKQSSLNNEDLLEVNESRWRKFFENLNKDEKDESNDIFKGREEKSEDVIQKIHEDWSSGSENDETNIKKINSINEKMNINKLQVNEKNPKILNHDVFRSANAECLKYCLTSNIVPKSSSLLENPKNSFIAQMKINFLKNIVDRGFSTEELELPKNAEVVEELTIVLDDWDGDEETNLNVRKCQQKEENISVQETYVNVQKSSQTTSSNIPQNKVQTRKRSVSPTRQKLLDILEGNYDSEVEDSYDDPIYPPEAVLHANTINDKDGTEDIVKSGSSSFIEKVINKTGSESVIDNNEKAMNSDKKSKSSSGIINRNKDRPDKGSVKIIRRGSEKSNNNKLENLNKKWREVVSNEMTSKKTTRDRVWEELTGKKVVEESDDRDMNEMVNNIVMDRLKTIDAKTAAKQRERKRKANIQIIYLDDDDKKKMKSDKTVDSDSERDDDSLKEKYMFCPTCTYKTKYSESFAQHVALHDVLDTVAKYKCRHCPFRTKDEKLLNSHNLIHLDLKLEYSCIVCGHVGRKKSKTNIFYHAVASHTTEDGTQMEKGFCKVTNKGSKETYFECLFCSLQSSDSTDFENHSKEHNSETSGQLRKIHYDLMKCDKCGFTTKRIENYDRHKKICNGHKPLDGVLVSDNPSPLLKCELCDYETRRYKGLVAHWIRKHNIPAPANPSNVVDDKVKEYTCPLCKKFTTHKKVYLRNHLRGKHNTALYECPFCPFDTRYIESYQRHLREKHDTIV